MEASALTHASRLGLLGRRSPLLRLQGDERLIALIRDGQERAFETLFERYQARLLAFCRGMLASAEDAEDVLQEVFVAAHKAIVADNRAINARPWLYRIARNRCLNHLRKPVPEGQDSMDIHPHENGSRWPNGSRSARSSGRSSPTCRTCPRRKHRTAPARDRRAGLRGDRRRHGYDGPSGQVTPGPRPDVPGRLQPGPASDLRRVHLELAEAAEGAPQGLGPAGAPSQLQAVPRVPLRAAAKRQGAGGAGADRAAFRPPRHAPRQARLGGAKIGAGSSGASARALRPAVRRPPRRPGPAPQPSAAPRRRAGGGMALAGSAAAGGIGGALGTKAAASVASVALLTAGAVEVNDYYQGAAESNGAGGHRAQPRHGDGRASDPWQRHGRPPARSPRPAEAPAKPSEAPAAPLGAPAEAPAELAPAATDADAVAGGAETGSGLADSDPTYEPEPSPPRWWRNRR